MREWLPLTSEEPRKKSRFTEKQMVAILREVDKAPVPEVARKHKVSAQAVEFRIELTRIITLR